MRKNAAGCILSYIHPSLSIISLGLILMISMTFSGIASAQCSLSAWEDSTPTVFRTDQFQYTLANAPLSGGEREQIYQSIVTKGSFWAGERKTILSAHVGLLNLTTDTSKQIVVESPSCGNGGCFYWIFVRRGGKLHLILQAEGALILRGSPSHGFYDVETSWHASGFEQISTIYRFNGTKYEVLGGYTNATDRDNPGAPFARDYHGKAR